MLHKEKMKSVDIGASHSSFRLAHSLCNPIDDGQPGSHPWDSPGKHTGAGCHFLFQCMKVQSESEVAQSCPTLRDPMDCSLPGSSVHGISQARELEWVAIAFSDIYVYIYVFFRFFPFIGYYKILSIVPCAVQ